MKLFLSILWTYLHSHENIFLKHVISIFFKHPSLVKLQKFYFFVRFYAYP